MQVGAQRRDLSSLRSVIPAGVEGPLRFSRSVIPTEVEGPLFLPSAMYNLSAIPIMVYHIYIMASASGVLYTGVTSHLEARVAQHKQRLFPGFSARYNTVKLVYFEPFSDVRDAIAREKQFKRWRREKKVFLIERANPTWRDLSADFPH
ncbi:MAG TPA: GIY-YIG nuclease family protein [Candidatus Acidoferrum sp.]|nr:GIY-YIG nuclease family protein [Candidatus Acidoferrum sp.]